MKTKFLLPTNLSINLLESPKPCPSSSPSSAPPSRSGYPPSISGTKCGIIDPLVSKRPEKVLNKKIQSSKEKCRKWSKMVKNGQNGQNGLKWSKMVPNGPKWFKMVQNCEK